MGEGWDLKTTTETSKNTFSSVLKSVFEKGEFQEYISATEFLDGIICSTCKDYVNDFDRIQHQVTGLEKMIIGRKRNENKKTERKEFNIKDNVLEIMAKEENMEVEQLISKRIGRGGKVEYL